jgi:hypothetical protein
MTGPRTALAPGHAKNAGNSTSVLFAPRISLASILQIFYPKNREGSVPPRGEQSLFISGPGPIQLFEIPASHPLPMLDDFAPADWVARHFIRLTHSPSAM